MTDVLNRVDVDPGEVPGGTGSSVAESGHTDLIEPEPLADQHDSFELSVPARVLVATLAGSVSLLAFTLIASHLPGSRLQAVALTAVAWLELAIAILAVARPSRMLLRRSMALNAVVVGAFMLSHTVGLPGGLRHPTSSATPTASVAAFLALALIAAAGLALARPALGRAWDSSALVLATLVPVAVLVLTTTALLVPRSTGTTDISVVDASTAGAATGPTSTLATSGSPAIDGESAEVAPDVPLDAATQKQLAAQLVIARAAALQYPTVADATRAGMVLAGGMAPGVGAHYEHLDATALAGVKPDGTIDASAPSSFIYAGTAADAPIVGVMFTSLGDTQPVGFAGPNDHWHRHSNLCLKFAGGKIEVPVAPDRDVTADECAGLGGHFLPKSVWMVHAWVVPGWESPKGVFSHDNPNLHCPGPLNADGSDRVDGVGFCLQQ